MHATQHVVPARRRIGRRPLGGHGRGGKEGERGRATALDRLREDEGRGCRDGQHRHLGHLRRRRDPLHRPRRHHDPRPADDEPPVPTWWGGRRGEGPLRADRGPGGAPQGTRRMSTAAAAILFTAVTLYAVFGGADFGAGFWDL